MSSSSLSLVSSPPSSRRCARCQEIKSLTEFYANKRNPLGVDYTCKECRKSYQREYGQTEKGRATRTKRLAAYYRENQDAHRLRKYGLSPEDYDRMFAEQEGKCAICNQPERAKLRGKIKALCVDHNHQTGEVRRLLCLGCNVKLGWLENNLTAVRNYLNI